MAVYPRTGDTEVPAQPDFPALEREVLDYWESEDTFRASIRQRPADREFVFYDGPPFANGLPHYGHLITGYVKDLVPRFRTMQGNRVERRFGWDCHGLPAEVEAERLLGISGKADILAMGIEKFNHACRESVLRYTREWRDYVTRQARWVDFDHDYKTLDLPYMESVMWAFQQLWDKGLVYQGFKVLPYCWRCETPLSNHELRMDEDTYRERQDPSVTVRFKLETGEWLLAWTTTPWTLPSNLACAVGADISYVVVAKDGERYILARDRQAAYERELEGAAVVGTLTGAELAGRRYEPLFGYLADAAKFGTQDAFRVILSDDVTTEDGTGVVHMAPAYGEADAASCNAAGIPTVLTVDEGARFTSVVPDFEGQHVFDANADLAAKLREQGSLVRKETYTHSYPHCWRCRNPLIYKAVSSWFVAVSTFSDRMVELNEQITWVPEHVKGGQFGKWLAGARDWSISRNRFWGSPIPVWQSDNPDYPRTDVYGSLDELERDFGVRPADLHRPAIDDLVRPNPDDPTGQSMMRRVPEVLDCWFESGSMPFAQVHYPFENREWFDRHYPGDFIVEYIGQTRGWFYTLHVLATALFDRPAFRSCVSHGIVLGDDGQKMSKSLRNYPDVNEVFDTFGSDAMRWFLMASPVLRGGNLIVTSGGISGRRPAGDPAAVELLLLLRPVRQRRVLRREAVDRQRARARPLHPGQDPGRGDRDRAVARRLQRRRRLPGAAGAPRGADQLVHPPVPQPVLGRRAGGARHLVDRARDRLPGRRAAAAADHRGGLARADRRAERAPGVVAGRLRLAGRRGADRRHGPGPRRVQHRARPAQGASAPGAAAAGVAGHRPRRTPSRWRRSPT